MTVRGYQLAFDWSRAGTYTGTLEDASSYVGDGDLTISVGRASSRAAAELPAGTLDFVLQERDDPAAFKFAPESTTSPIAGKVVPGVPGVFNVTVAGATTNLFDGALDRFTYDPYARTLSGTIMDAWGKPGAEKLSTEVYQGYRTGDLIGVVLDAIGWTGGRDIDPGATVVPYWWEEGTDAATAIQKLIDSEGTPAVGYVQAGTFVFRDRHHRLFDTASTTSQGTFTHVYPEGTGPAGQFKILTGSFAYSHGLDSIVNTATFDVGVRAPAPTAAVWSTDSPISVPAGTTVTVFASAAEPFINAAVPVVATYDVEGNRTSGDYELAYGTVASMSLSRTSGQSLVLSITAGGADAYITQLQIPGSPLPVARTQKVTASDAGSVATKGTLTWPNDAPWAGVYDALAIAQRIVSVYSVARPVMTFEIEASLTSSTGVLYATQFAARQVSDRVTVRNDLVGFNGDCHIERVERIVQSLGKGLVRLRLTCEPVPDVGAANPFTFNLAGAGFNDGQFDADGIDNPATVFRFDVAGQGFNQGFFGN